MNERNTGKIGKTKKNQMKGKNKMNHLNWQLLKKIAFLIE